jgi:hypothetical protein
MAFADFRVTRPTQRVDETSENLLAFGDALLRHHGVGILRGSARSGNRASKENDSGNMDVL